jgi:hypothetical protein
MLVLLGFLYGARTFINFNQIISKTDGSHAYTVPCGLLFCLRTEKYPYEMVTPPTYVCVVAFQLLDKFTDLYYIRKYHRMPTEHRKL